jgi:hypothetical protein
LEALRHAEYNTTPYTVTHITEPACRVISSQGSANSSIDMRSAIYEVAPSESSGLSGLDQRSHAFQAYALLNKQMKQAKQSLWGYGKWDTSEHLLRQTEPRGHRLSNPLFPTRN